MLTCGVAVPVVPVDADQFEAVELVAVEAVEEEARADLLAALVDEPELVVAVDDDVAAPVAMQAPSDAVASRLAMPATMRDRAAGRRRLPGVGVR
ncbi:MAG: hypothetical protein ACXVK4_10020 [Acidimicrobiia bacterium]